MSVSDANGMGFIFLGEKCYDKQSVFMGGITSSSFI
jgi:hypothetical protein